MQLADRCSPGNVSIDTTNPSSSMSADDKHKTPQPEESPLELETCSRENSSVEFTNPIKILPFFHIPNPQNINPALCEASTFDSCEEREHQKENENREDNIFLKGEVFKKVLSPLGFL